MKNILIIEDGDEYEKFARLFLSDVCEISVARSARQALELLEVEPASAFLVDLRFDRASPDDLVGGLEDTAKRMFAGDMARALSYLKDNQGTLILAELRENGHCQPAVFVHEFARGRLENLKSLYGDVRAVPSFDAGEIRRALGL